MQRFSELSKGTYERVRHDLVPALDRARVLGDQRVAVILSRRFVNSFPSYGLSPIERAVRETFRNILRESKDQLTHVCPVCKTTMYDITCPDDSVRPYCAQCGKTYTPRGYDDEDNYALTWTAKTWDGSTEPEEMITA